ncbi:MAG TPA: VCBS domain-containing protein, partial [Bradyrhizobium sp.]|nr:VCBS domain-containing protein [Bradyrhizobium sp.]
MNFVGKFGGSLPVEGAGLHPKAQLHVDSLSSHAPPNAIVVQDAHLLFHGDYKRAGVDLVISKDGHELVVPDYFRGEKRAALASPDGAHLTGDIVNALTGHTQLAQADGSASVAKVIGHVTKLVGDATVVRNGVAIVLNLGDNVNQGDVVQAGSNATLGITFIDGSVFGLGSNAKMVLNEMIYDPNGSSNSSLLSLVQGTISFVAGATAKHGDMKVDTPVATMGIRGTAVLVEIDFEVPGTGTAPPAKFQVLVEPDGTTGSYLLLDKVTLAPIATVNQAGQVVAFSPATGVSVGPAALSPEAQKLVVDVFAQKFTDLSNPTTKTASGSTGSVTPDTQLVQNKETTETKDVKTTVVGTVEKTTTTSTSSSTTSNDRVPLAPTLVVFGGALAERDGVTGSSEANTRFGTAIFADANQGDRPTVSTAFDKFAFKNAQGVDITSTLNHTQNNELLTHIEAVEVKLVVQQDGSSNNGTASWTYSVPDKAFDFLAAGETLTLTYIATVDNNFKDAPQSTSLPFQIFASGTNDAPVITTGQQFISYTGGTTTVGGALHTDDPTSGTLVFDDTDLSDTHTTSVKLTGASLSGSGLDGSVEAFRAAFPGPGAIFEDALTITLHDSTGSGTGSIDWNLADLSAYLADFVPAGETLTLTYTVTVTDNHGVTSAQEITVTITGDNSPAVVWIATTQAGSDGSWHTGSNWGTGNVPTANDDAIIITNQLQNLTPYYPITISGAAFAKSLVMDDFEATAPELDIDAVGSLAISGTFELRKDAIVDNSGAIDVGGPMEILGASVLTNSGTLNLNQGGDFKDTGSVTNLGTGVIDLKAGTLNDFVAIINNGLIRIESGALLVMNGGSITGGAVDNLGTIEIAGDSSINNDQLTNHQLTVDSGKTLTLDDVTVNGGTITDNGTVKVEAGRTLKLNGVALSGGAISNLGAIEIAGSGSINNNQLANNQLTVDSSRTLTLDDTAITGGAVTNNGATLMVHSGKTLTLDDVTVSGGTVADGGTVKVDAGRTLKLNGVALSGGAINNLGTIEITGNSSISNDQFANNQLTIDSGKTLTLSGATVTGGTVTDSGIVRVSGDSAINGAALNGGQVTVDAATTLTLDNTTVTGATFIDSGTVKVDAARALTLSGATITGGALDNSGNVDSTGSNFLTNVNVTNGGTVEIVNGALAVTGSIAGGGSIQIDQGALLQLGATVSGAQKIVFDGAGSSELEIDASSLAGSVLGGQIVGFGTSDRLDLTTIVYDATTTAFYSAVTGVLTVTDGHGDSVSMTLVGDYTNAHFAGSNDGGHTLITLKANDDAPVIAAADKTGSASVAELAATTGAATLDFSNPVSGTIHFTDIDLTDRPTAMITAQTVTWNGGTLVQAQIDALAHGLSLTPVTNTNNGAITWTYSIADSALDFLGQNQTAMVTSTITLDDHQGGSDTATVTITVTGANDVPVVDAAQAGTLVDTALYDTFANLTGQLVGHDVDQGETRSLAYAALDAAGHAVNTAVAGHYGSLTVNANGTYSYAADAAAINALPAGSYSDTFTVQTRDVHGATGTALLTVNVTGANDDVSPNPVVGPTDTNGGANTVAENAANGTAVGITAHATDADAGTTITYSLLNNAGGRFAIDANTGVVTVANG